MSGYFAGPKPAGKVALPPSLNPGGDHRFDPPAAPRIQVSAHSRAAPTKPTNTAKLEPSTKHGDSQRFYKPLRPGQKPDGYESVGGRPGRAGIGSPVTSRPYWLATRGPAGDQASQLSSAQVTTARQAGVHPTVAMDLLNSAVHPLTDLSKQVTGESPFKLGGAASDVARIN